MDQDFAKNFGNKIDELQIYIRKYISFPIQSRAKNECKIFELTRAESSIIAAVYLLEAQSIKDLSRIVNLAYSVTSRLVCKLAGLGFVERRENPNERNMTAVHIAPAGRELVEETNVKAAAIGADIMNDSWTDEDQRTMFELMSKLTEILKKADNEPRG